MDERFKQTLRAAREHYDRREFAQAEALLREILGDVERFADVHNMLGVMAHERRDFEEAEARFLRALELNPRYTEASLNLAVTYNDLGKFDYARAIHERATAAQAPVDGIDPFVKGKIANMHADVAQAYAEIGLFRDAIPELEKAVALCPQFADLRWRLGNLHRELGDGPRARAEYEAAKAANPLFVKARVSLAVLLIAAGERAQAEEELQQVLSIDAEHKTAQMYLRMLTGSRPSMSRPPLT